MRALIIIPARLASTRLPGKPLAKIAGIPMVIGVARAVQAAGHGPPVIAAADEAIVRVARAYGVRAVLTDAALTSGSDRVCVAAAIIDPDRKAQIVVNVQGDMPELAPEHLDAVITALSGDPDADIATLAFQSDRDPERRDDNVVKVLMDEPVAGKAPRALAFTRSLKGSKKIPFWHHIGIYAFRRAALQRFCALPPSPREQRENLEQWRALENGMKIVCAVVHKDCPGIDSPEDLARIRALWERGKKT